MTKIELRDYQKEAVKSVLTHVKKGVRLQVLIMCVGSGKTFTFATIAKKVLESGKKVLVLAHRQELQKQNQKSLHTVNPGAKVQIEQGDEVVDDDCDIIVASMQTLGREGSERIKKFKPEEYGAIIIDECQRSTGNGYKNILNYFGAHKNGDNFRKNHPVVLGFTGTPSRGDGVSLDKIFDEVVFSYPMEKAIKDGYLTPIRAYTVFTDTDISGVKSSMGDFATGELSDTVNNPERNLQIVETYLEKCKDEKIIIFAVNVKHADDIAKTFRNEGVEAEYIAGILKKPLRDNIIERYKRGDFKVLVNVQLLVEGFDCPSINAVFLASPTKSQIKYVQSIGRGVRLFPGKKYCKIFDFLDNMKNNKIQTAANLIGITQPIQADDTDIYEMKDKLEELLENKPGTNLRELDLSTIDEKIQEVDIFAAAELDVFVKENSRYSWTTFLGGFKISLGENEQGDKLFLEIRLNILEHYECKVIKLIKQIPTFENKYKSFSKEEILAFESTDKKEALKLGDKVIKDNFADRVNLVSQGAKWKKEPPSEKQIGILLKNGYPNGGKLTKGQATQLISKIFSEKYGK